jgi:hypothetical protein
VTRAVELTALALGGLVVLALLVGGARRARRLGGRPTYARRPASAAPPIEPMPVPALFDEPV